MMGFETGTPEPRRQGALVPTDALLFHSADGSHFVTHHPVSVVKGLHTLGAGRALRVEDARRLLEGLLGISKEQGGVELLAPELLMRDPTAEAWYVPGRKRPMHFRMPKGGFTGVLEVVWPTLLFVATRHELRIAALGGSGRPSAATPVYHAPLMNIFSDGRVCRAREDGGSSPLSQGKAWCEDAVFKTAFSHLNHQVRTRETDAAHVRFWKARNRKAVSVGSKDMCSMGRTVEQFIAGCRA